MLRDKIVLGNYNYIIDYFDASNGETDVNHYENFYLLKNQEYKTGILVDKDIYIISKTDYDNNNFVYPISHNVSGGYSTNPSKFSPNLTENVLNKETYKIYNSNGKEYSLLCDKIRIYIPTINNSLNAIIDIQNFINDIQFHYLINLFSSYTRKSETEFSIGNQVYSEYIDIYIPSIHKLVYSEDIYINEYNRCINSKNQEELNLTGTALVPFNLLYYPYSISSDIKTDGSVIYTKEFDIKPFYINNQYYSTLNLILYPYTGIDSDNYYIPNTELNQGSCTFNINISFNFKSIIKFPTLEDFHNNEDDYNKYYGVPCIISDFDYPLANIKSLEERF